MIIIKGLRILFELSSIYLICASLYTAITGEMGLALFTMFIAWLMYHCSLGLRIKKGIKGGTKLC